jgi:dipeptide/tripeptide permease
MTPSLLLFLSVADASLIACTAIVYVQDQVSWTVGFALPASAMASAVLLFLAGSKHYRCEEPPPPPGGIDSHECVLSHGLLV